MNHIAVPDLETPAALLERMQELLYTLPPEVQKAAAYLLEEQASIGLLSARQQALAAGVKPNTMVRLARQLGFDGYDGFRAVFQQDILRADSGFQDRARWLQSLSRKGELGRLYADMASVTLTNVETTLAGFDAPMMRAAAKTLLDAPSRYMLGVGINHALAESFCYLADMASVPIQPIPRYGSLAIDDLAHARPGDVMIAITFKPYRREVTSAVDQARAQKVKIIGISDSPASPIVAGSEHGFVVQTETPQFYTSIVATMALLETLMAFVVAEAKSDVVNDIKAFHDRRHQLGIYTGEKDR